MTRPRQFFRFSRLRRRLAARQGCLCKGGECSFETADGPMAVSLRGIMRSPKVSAVTPTYDGPARRTFLPHRWPQLTPKRNDGMMLVIVVIALPSNRLARIIHAPTLEGFPERVK